MHQGIKICVLFALWMLCGCSGRIEEHPEFYGRHYQEVATELGEPTNLHHFTLTDSTALLPEYQGGLYHFKQPGKDLLIREATWSLPLYRRLVIWFTQEEDQWVGLEGLSWNTLTVAF